MHRRKWAGRKFKVVDFEPDSIATRSYQPSRRVSYFLAPVASSKPITATAYPHSAAAAKPLPPNDGQIPTSAAVCSRFELLLSCCCPIHERFERRRSLIDKERNQPRPTRRKKGRVFLLKSNTIRGKTLLIQFSLPINPIPTCSGVPRPPAEK